MLFRKSLRVCLGGVMLRDASRNEVRRVAAPLWLLVNHSLSPDDFNSLNVTRRAACSIVAHLAYCAIGADERERRNRAKVVPSHVFQELLASEEFDLAEALASIDFVDVEVVRTRGFVAVIVPARDLFLIGVRGTQFAYDWLINAKVWKIADARGERFHRGFLREAEELTEALRERFYSRFAPRIRRFRDGCTIWLSGHSLGGAIAAIINHLELPLRTEACYTFGSPRISNLAHLESLRPTFATHRQLDIVPHCPPKTLGYANFSHEIAPDGGTYVPAGASEMYSFASWIAQLAVSRFPKNHSMECYRSEVIEPAKNDPLNRQYWKPQYDLALSG